MMCLGEVVDTRFGTDGLMHGHMDPHTPTDKGHFYSPFLPISDVKNARGMQFMRPIRGIPETRTGIKLQ